MNLFISYTPLHVLIIKKIIEHKEVKNFILVYLCFLDNDKNRFYYNVLKELAVDSYYLPLKHYYASDVLNLFRLVRAIKKKHGNKNIDFFTGNIKKFHSRFLLLSLLKKIKSVYTFDDGSGNISGSGYFYEPSEPTLNKLFFFLFKKDLLYKNIVNKIKKHFTIFEQRNVYSNSEYLKGGLLNSQTSFDRQDKQNKTTKTILLGNAFCEDEVLTFEEEVLLYKRICDYFKVSHYLPHPRSNLQKTAKGITIVKTDLISEDYLLTQKSLSLKIIGVYSTVLLNLSNTPDITIINVKTKLNKPTDRLDELFDLLKIENITI